MRFSDEGDSNKPFGGKVVVFGGDFPHTGVDRKVLHGQNLQSIVVLVLSRAWERQNLQSILPPLFLLKLHHFSPSSIILNKNFCSFLTHIYPRIQSFSMLTAMLPMMKTLCYKNHRSQIHSYSRHPDIIWHLRW